MLELESHVFIIGGQGAHGETLMSCEKLNLSTQRVSEVPSLSLLKNSLSGVVSSSERALYVAGSPLIVDNRIEIQKYEIHTNYWSVLTIDVSYLTLK